MKIKLTQGKFAIVDYADFLRFARFNWSFHSAGYAFRKIGNKNAYMHREIMRPPKGMEVDHINGDKLDNRRENLRVCTHAQNSRNRKGINVSFDKRKHKWRAQIGIGMKQKWLGYFATKEAAAKAYRDSANKEHGQFACVSY